MGTRIRLAIGTVVVAVVVVVPGSSEARRQAQAPSPAATQGPTFRSEVTLVSTDVIPRDAQGRFVPDLTPSDFEIIEDGVPQTITSFTLINGGRTYNLLDPPAPDVPEGIVLPTQNRASTTVAGRVLIVIIDDLHFEPEHTPLVRRVVEQLAETLIHEGDLVALLSTGPSSIETGLTTDRKLVADSIRKVRGSGLTAQDIFRSLDSSQGPVDIRNRAQLAFTTAYNLLGSLEQIPNKRKAVVYISTGYDFDPYAEGRRGRDRIMGGRFSEPTRFLRDDENPYFRLNEVSADIDLYAFMRELTLSANRANATVYTVDPRGLAGVVDAGQYIDQSEWRTFLQKTQSTLRYMAVETGGFAVVNDNDFVSAFKRIDAETSDYYVIGFYSSNPDPQRRVRELEIRTRREGVAVASRQAYSLRTPGVAPKPPALRTTAPAPRRKK